MPRKYRLHTRYMFTRQRHLDTLLRTTPWFPPRTNMGWIKAIRTAIGMPQFELARRMNVSKAYVSRLEKRELKKSITLKELERAASAIECDLCYVIKPRTEMKVIYRKLMQSPSTLPQSSSAPR